VLLLLLAARNSTIRSEHDVLSNILTTILN